MISLFSNKRKEKQPQGLIKYHNLTEWWKTEFNEKERQAILDNYNPLGASGREQLIESDIVQSSQSVIGFLNNLSGYLDKKEYIQLQKKILSKIKEFIPSQKDIIDKHFYYQQMIETNYKRRNEDSEALLVTEEYCLKQIEIAPFVKDAMIKEYNDNFLPGHLGFKQLTIIEEKRKNYDKVIDLSKEAMKQGWNGDWKKRIERCFKKK